MARYIAQLIIAGTQVVARAFARAVKQEIEASQQAAQRLGNAKTRTERVANQKLGLSLEEAKQILNITNLTKSEVEEKYQSLFKANEKTSLYLQSKFVRAKERLEHELSTSETNKDNQSEQADKKT
ncbi:mitochondrial import inner membrane translocase subunit tim16-like [Diorhabda carinulata]|uniref:mitochondrial import inner membrane translocase subunit tim16-like n=1 Tax=Diorhabda sublineata TaxID=1163346 RepID=UPI0024E0CA00|nr:mitochondrial import inner membrane translocase subunit tim16-like [Diorhabda sublineata]XP_057658561.1 mitochondrial import inner membrane translocase subunit tim16-like [Diorhabda carinulata]